MLPTDAITSLKSELKYVSKTDKSDTSQNDNMKHSDPKLKSSFQKWVFEVALLSK